MNANQSQRRNLNKKILIGVGIIVALFVVIGAVGSKSDNTGKDGSTDNKQSSTQKSSESLASRVEKKYLEFWGITNLTELHSLEGVSLNSRSITGFEDYGSGNVLVHVQQNINKDEAKEVGRHVMGAVGIDIKDVDFIVVRGTDGRDVNVSRNDIPALR